MRNKIQIALLTLTFTMVLLPARPSLGFFHLVKVQEVFPGSAANPNAQYVVIDVSGSQNLVGGHSVIFYDASGQAAGTFTFAADLGNGGAGARALIATAEASALFNLSSDLVMTPSIVAAGGKVCFDTFDCVSWGSYTATDAGTPFNASGGLTLSRAIRRAGGDTNNSAADFDLADAEPRNNAGAVGSVTPGSCGNGTLEALEQCDDGNTTSGDGCSSACTPDAPQIDAGAPDTGTALDGGIADSGSSADATAPADAGGRDAQPALDGAPAPDAGSPTDSGAATPPPDSGIRADGSSGGSDAGGVPETDDGGCGCKSERENGAVRKGLLAWLTLLGVVLLVRRRRA